MPDPLAGWPGSWPVSASVAPDNSGPAAPREPSDREPDRGRVATQRAKEQADDAERVAAHEQEGER
jgi:hypothetical protein